MRTIAVLGLSAACALAQITPAPPAGAVLHHVQGKVFVDDIDRSGVSPGDSPAVLAPGSVIRTSLGLAEVLLAPGMILRSGENTAVKLVQTTPAVHLQLVEGAVTIEIAQAAPLVVDYQDAKVEIRRPGIYRLGGDPPEALVYEGEAEVTKAGVRKKVKRGGAASLASPSEARKFDASKSDSLMRWSSRRAQSMGLANIAAARYYSDNGLPWSMGGWVFNRYFGMYTYLPVGSGYRSPWGFYYCSPSSVYAINRAPGGNSGSGFSASGPRYGYDSNNGYNTVSQRTYDTYTPPPSTASSAPAATAAPSEPSTRSGEGAAGRGGEGGGRSQ